MAAHEDCISMFFRRKEFPKKQKNFSPQNSTINNFHSIKLEQILFTSISAEQNDMVFKYFHVKRSVENFNSLIFRLAGYKITRENVNSGHNLPVNGRIHCLKVRPSSKVQMRFIILSMG